MGLRTSDLNKLQSDACKCQLLPEFYCFLDVLAPMDCNLKPGFIKDCGVAGNAFTIINWLKPFGLT